MSEPLGSPSVMSQIYKFLSLGVSSKQLAQVASRFPVQYRLLAMCRCELSAGNPPANVLVSVEQMEVVETS